VTYEALPIASTRRIAMKTMAAFIQRSADVPFAEAVLRLATALLITFAAAFVLIHAQVYAGGQPHPTTVIFGAVAG
jgi:hypothetical protein